MSRRAIFFTDLRAEIERENSAVNEQQREALAAMAADTPIKVGTLEINSQARLVAEIEIAGNLG